MPVGKNSIRRVANNGYSKVKTEAPDMENSTVVAARKTRAPRSTVKPKTTTEDKAKITAQAETEVGQPDNATMISKTDKSYVNVGDRMPYYLL